MKKGDRRRKGGGRRKRKRERMENAYSSMAVTAAVSTVALIARVMRNGA